MGNIDQLGPSDLPDSKLKGSIKRREIKNWWLSYFPNLLKCNRESLKTTTLQDSRRDGTLVQISLSREVLSLLNSYLVNATHHDFSHS